ncbi:hypothetical protein CEUSTIGMA_g2049.t1 [Chlamydomonas eustigma]|uniref:Uncharacterized protein n=1 Tax=Chlamydomonas eustigma TaxID=1157962 RepID=A0A250WUW1_9CHLO|nr:hypothetical protein CEUSTIGMA_g2049.t1 [Chlamydomonas eustigma]|eukprot:GAX74601.1 hypothetical protein CEUSTIGMA_g2049.t1 [Chlamydomonas eustigma]
MISSNTEPKSIALDPLISLSPPTSKYLHKEGEKAFEEQYTSCNAAPENHKKTDDTRLKPQEMSMQTRPAKISSHSFSPNVMASVIRKRSLSLKPSAVSRAKIACNSSANFKPRVHVPLIHGSQKVTAEGMPHLSPNRESIVARLQAAGSPVHNRNAVPQKPATLLNLNSKQNTFRTVPNIKRRALPHCNSELQALKLKSARMSPAAQGRSLSFSQPCASVQIALASADKERPEQINKDWTKDLGQGKAIESDYYPINTHHELPTETASWRPTGHPRGKDCHGRDPQIDFHGGLSSVSIAYSQSIPIPQVLMLDSVAHLESTHLLPFKIEAVISRKADEINTCAQSAAETQFTPINNQLFTEESKAERTKLIATEQQNGAEGLIIVATEKDVSKSSDSSHPPMKPGRCCTEIESGVSLTDQLSLTLVSTADFEELPEPRTPLIAGLLCGKNRDLKRSALPPVKEMMGKVGRLMPYAQPKQHVSDAQSCWPENYADDFHTPQLPLPSSSYCRSASVKQVQLSLVPHAADFEAAHQCLDLVSNLIQGSSSLTKHGQQNCCNVNITLIPVTHVGGGKEAVTRQQHVGPGGPMSAALRNNITSLFGLEENFQNFDLLGKLEWDRVLEETPMFVAQSEDCCQLTPASDSEKAVLCKNPNHAILNLISCPQEQNQNATDPQISDLRLKVDQGREFEEIDKDEAKLIVEIFKCGWLSDLESLMSFMKEDS